MTVASRTRSAGFTLIEMMVALVILGVIVGAVVMVSNSLVRANNTMSTNVDMIQQGRQFMDQIANDIHMAGYPNYYMIDHTDTSDQSKWAGASTGVSPSGVISATSTSLQFEGDIDNSGTISEVYLQLYVPSGGCPCTMRRGTLSKSVYLAGTSNPSYYTELANVMNQDVFSYWDYDGNSWSSSEALVNLRAVRLKLQVQSTYKDMATEKYPVVTLDSTVKLSNY